MVIPLPRLLLRQKFHCCVMLGAWACGAVLLPNSSHAQSESPSFGGSFGGSLKGGISNIGGDQLKLSLTETLDITREKSAAMGLIGEIEQLYKTQRHDAAGTKGLQFLSQGGKGSDDLRLSIANSLAWTGRQKQADAVYETLLNTAHDAQARLALANSRRWSGRADLAQPMYEQLVTINPVNRDARDGLAYSERELRPSTLVTAGGTADSGLLKQNYLHVAHRWRDDTGSRIYGVEARGFDFRDEINHINSRTADLTLRYQPLDVRFQPAFYVTASGVHRNHVFAGVRLQLLDNPTHLYLDHLNWGVLSSTASSIAAGQTANHVGLDTRLTGSLGDLYARADFYGVSDTNLVRTTQLRYTVPWRPFGQAVKFYAAADTRDVRFHTPMYWSPATGSGTGSLGATGEWVNRDWLFVVGGQAGRPLYGEAGNSWSASATAKRWISPDYAVGFNLWAMSSWRDGANYRAGAASINLEKLW